MSTATATSDTGLIPASAPALALASVTASASDGRTPMANLCDRFLWQAARQPEAPLMLGPGADECISYGAFAARVNDHARRLQDAGITAGANVGLHHPSGSEYIAWVYALWRCGAAVTPIPFELTATEKRQVFDAVHMDAVITSERLRQHLDGAVTAAAAISPVALPGQAWLVPFASPVTAPPGLAALDPAFIRFTSGTTGEAKGVVLSHRTIGERIEAANAALVIGPADRVLWLLSMDYHFAVSIGAYLTLGAAIILPRNSFGVTLLAAANRHQATLIYGSPAHYALMTQDDTEATLPDSLRLAVVTTTALPADTAEAFQSRFGRVLNETYGIIELGLPAINTSCSPARRGSVGRPLPAYELRLDTGAGTASGDDKGDDTTGEILIRGPGMLDAYYSPWRLREVILADGGGWFHTGDLGRLDPDGFLTIVGRSKEVLSVGGMKFFPYEVEQVLEAHPAVAAACVFGIREPHWWEPVQALLVARPGVPRPDDDALDAWCRAVLANHKVPGRLRWVAALPLTASGKKVRNAQRLAQLIPGSDEGSAPPAGQAGRS